MLSVNSKFSMSRIIWLIGIEKAGSRLKFSFFNTNKIKEKKK